jgi:hypothetical protein
VFIKAASSQGRPPHLVMEAEEGGAVAAAPRKRPRRDEEEVGEESEEEEVEEEEVEEDLAASRRERMRALLAGPRPSPPSDQQERIWSRAVRMRLLLARPEADCRMVATPQQATTSAASSALPIRTPAGPPKKQKKARLEEVNKEFSAVSSALKGVWSAQELEDTPAMLEDTALAVAEEIHVEAAVPVAADAPRANNDVEMMTNDEEDANGSAEADEGGEGGDAGVLVAVPHAVLDTPGSAAPVGVVAVVESSSAASPSSLVVAAAAKQNSTAVAFCRYGSALERAGDDGPKVDPDASRSLDPLTRGASAKFLCKSLVDQAQECKQPNRKKHAGLGFHHHQSCLHVPA